MPRGHKWTDAERAKSIATRKLNALRRKAAKKAFEAKRRANDAAYAEREAQRQQSLHDHAVNPNSKGAAKTRTNVHEPPTLNEEPETPPCWNCGGLSTQVVKFHSYNTKAMEWEYETIYACDSPNCYLHYTDY